MGKLGDLFDRRQRAGGSLRVDDRDEHGGSVFERVANLLRLDDPARAPVDPTGADAPDEKLTEAMGWPRDIKKEAEGLRVTWSDGHVSVYPFPTLRALCKCAGCTGGH